ncbi:MAG: primosomal protein N' [Dictyoglomus thermophilum]|nr:primosomal protein N' [Dictyoglomus thermophilum]
MVRVSKVVLFDTYIPEKDFLYYSIPEEFTESADIGKAVVVPLKKSRKLGYIWDIEEIEDPEFEVYPILSILENIPPLSKPLVRLVNWISEYYSNSLYKTANYIFPSGVELEVLRYLKARDTVVEMSKKQEKIFLALIDNEMEEKSLKKSLKVSESVIKALLKKGAIEERFEIKLIEKKPRKHVYLSEKKGDSWGSFTIDKKILDLMKKPILLFIESRDERWKTYFEIMKHFYQRGKSILFVFPTIKSLIQFGDFLSQYVPFSIYFYHSFLTEAQSYSVFKVATTEQAVVLSTSKGLFLPFKDLGVIIVDQEENEFYNMREKEPRYDSVVVALKRGELEGIPVVLGSSSPSIVSFYRTIYREMELYRKPLFYRPQITVIDLRKDKTQEILDFYSLRKIEENLRNRRKVFILLNRLGYSPYIQCQDCGYIFMCPHCKSSLVYHLEEKIMKCHYCGFEMLPPQRCPVCEGYSFVYGGIGTEKLYRYLVNLYDRAKVLRIDSEVELQDETIIYGADIVVGTRLIEPWLDDEKIGLLIIYNLDNFLHIPDFASPEKTFNMIKRIIGIYKGREMIIRTYNPSHYVVRALKINSFGNFLNRELLNRKSLNYPPFSKIHQILLEDIDEKEILDEGGRIVSKIKEEFKDLAILGPAPYFPYFVRDKYRYQIIIKDNENLISSDFLKKVCEENRSPFSNLKFIINIDMREIIT